MQNYKGVTNGEKMRFQKIPNCSTKLDIYQTYAEKTHSSDKLNDISNTSFDLVSGNDKWIISDSIDSNRHINVFDDIYNTFVSTQRETDIKQGLEIKTKEHRYLQRMLLLLFKHAPM